MAEIHSILDKPARGDRPWFHQLVWMTSIFIATAVYVGSWRLFWVGTAWELLSSGIHVFQHHRMAAKAEWFVRWVVGTILLGYVAYMLKHHGL